MEYGGWDREDVRSGEAHGAMIARLRADIVARADAMGESGWMEIDVPAEVRPGGKLRVPRGPFEMWAVARSGGGHLATPWRPLSPQGLRLGGDDRFHSDWMLGAGLELSDLDAFGPNPHAEALENAALDAKFGIQRRLLGFECDVLLPGPWRSCIVFVPSGPADLPNPDDYEAGDDGEWGGDGGTGPAAILPDAGPDWLDVAHAALKLGGAVIVERGGAMAHLVTALRGDCEGPIVRIPGARRKFAPGAAMYVSTAAGSVDPADPYRIDLDAPPAPSDKGEITLHAAAFTRFANVPDPFKP